MRIAVIGSGIAGLGSAWLLSSRHEVTLFEADTRLGGHVHTHAVEHEGRHLAVDSGFIVFNGQHYPLLTRLFAELGVASQATTMSFSVQDAASGLEYNAGSLDGLFCQRRNLVRPRFLRMVADIMRFYREAPRLLRTLDDTTTLAAWLHDNGYSAAFRDQHLVPMAVALWSMSARQVLDFPLRHLLSFMDNHHMLQVSGRPEWRVVQGGSRTYVDAIAARWRVETRIDCRVRGIRRSDDGVDIVADGDTGGRFDAVVLACHADDALALLDDPSPVEQRVLSSLPYQDNDAVLHTDARLLPRHRKAWAAWNAYVPASPDAPCTVSYCMNLLQGFETRDPLVVTLNRTADIDPARILARMRYRHPLQTPDSARAQTRRGELQGQRNTWFAGAYWGHGFHEDGLRSAVDVADALGVPWT